jgi:hypothetical protein
MALITATNRTDIARMAIMASGLMEVSVGVVVTAEAVMAAWAGADIMVGVVVDMVGAVDMDATDHL